MTHAQPDDQSPAGQLESYAADLSRTYSELRRQLQRLTVLHEVSTRIAAALDPDEVLAGMLDSLGQLLRYQTAHVYLLDLDVAPKEATQGGRSVVPANTPPRVRAGRAFSGAPLPIDEGAEVDEDSPVVQAMRDQQTVGRAGAEGTVDLAVPLRAGGRALGALELRVAQALPEDDVKVIELLAAAAAVALQNAHLYQETQRLATTDPLTGLSNYRHFYEMLNLEVQRARRMDYPVGLVIMDLDHFKQVNDRHGHPLGDVALRQVSERLRSRLRRTDVVARLGGEEFAAILPGANDAEVAVVAEKVRRAVEDLPPLRGGMTTLETPITLSVGGASLEPEEVDAELLVSCADQALYQAKRDGRNRARLWNATLQVGLDPAAGERPAPTGESVTRG